MSYSTDDLITTLTVAAPVRPPVSPFIMMIAMALLGWGVTYLYLGVRPDMAALPFGLWAKTGLLSALSLLACLALRQAIRPASAPLPILPFIITSMVFAVWFGFEWGSVPAQTILAYLDTPNFWMCFKNTLLYGVATCLALTILVRQNAPINTGRAAMLIGLAGALVAGLAYSIACPIDSPTFIMIAYGLPTMILMLANRLIVPRFLRW